jgi:proteasome accessory factor C
MPVPSRAAERLQRLLAVVPYVVQHPGARLHDLATMFQTDEGALVEDLNLLFVSGLPPYGPGDLIDVQIEDGRVWIDMADYFARPMRMSRSEALALYLQGKALLGTPGLPEAAALRSALARLEEHLGPDTLGRLAGRVETAEEGEPAETLDVLRRAAEAHERLEIEYYSASSEETAGRVIEPEAVFAALGNWYVVAWDVTADGERLFRADRVRRAAATGARFEPRGLAGAGRRLYSRSEEDVAVTLLLGPAARWVAEYYETESVKERAGGRLEVAIPTKRLPVMARLVLSLGDEATIAGPPELERAVREVAERSLARYRTSRKKTSA